MMNYKALACLLLLWLLQACEQAVEPPIKIAINPWPGYEFLYLAEKKGFFKEVGLNIELLQLVSLADAQRAYSKHQVDGLASTIIEAVQAEPMGGKPLKIVMVPDYSNGGDVIISGADITDMTQLKGKNVGAEIASLGIFVLERALSKAGLALSDVSLVNIEQSQGEQSLLSGRIDAFVSYPPASIAILKHDQFRKIFSSDQIPKEVIDTVSLSQEVIARNPGVVEKLHKAWQMSLDYARENKAEAYGLMSDREGISLQEFEDTLSDLIVLDANEQRKLLDSADALQAAVKSVCQTMVYVESIETDCDSYPDIIYRRSH